MTAHSRVSLVTIVGLGLLLLPLTTMWHEIGGHAAVCFLQGGRVTTIGAFYVDCDGLVGRPRILVACAGVMMDAVLALLTYALWRRARGDTLRLALWYVWVTKAFVAAGYFCFSGATGIGDLGPGEGGGIGPLPMPFVWRAGELALGAVAYVTLVRLAIRTLGHMTGRRDDAGTARRIALGYYLTIGALAVVVGLFNPIGIWITIFSAAASSFGGNAGFMSVAFAPSPDREARAFFVKSSPVLLAAGALAAAAFAIVLGPSIHP